MITKILLIVAALGVGVLLFRDRAPGRQLVLRRLAGLTVVVLGIVAVLWPMLTTKLANAVGVGRGTDLVLYVLVMVFIYSAVATSQRIHRLEHTVTTLVRELALREAAAPPHEDDRSSASDGDRSAP